MEDEFKILTAGITIFVILFLIAFFGSFYIVSAGERAVVTTFGKPDMVAKAEGLHFKIPIIQKAVKMSVQTQKYEADLTAASKDLQDVQTKIAINYHVVPEQVPTIYRDIGVNYAFTVIQPLEQEANKGVTAQFTAEQLITNREEVRSRMKEMLAERLAPRGIIVEDISIVNFAFSPSFTAAIEAKVTAEQNALAAKNKLAQIEYEAQQKVATANGDAQAISIKGQALRENPAVIELSFIEKWDGKLSLVSGSSGNIMDITQLMKVAQ
jgi:regulator of protease activity HflC (stomatin/prohibitin superfamily)